MAKSLYNQVPLETAVEWTTAWKDKTNMSGTEFRASLIPMEDVIDIMNEIRAKAVRAYNGFDAANNKFKLLLVGVDAMGDEMIVTGHPELTRIYDMTTPCPDICNVDSPLYTCTLPEEA